MTSVAITAGQRVKAGDVLYRVDLRPVVAARGTVPAFRDLGPDARGQDVVQLQQLLAGLGFYGGAVDGRLGPGTEAAVRSWQKDLGMEDTGVVRLGDLIFLRRLPASIALDEFIAIGQILAGGEPAVFVVGKDPVFTIVLSVDQRNLVPVSAPVLISYPEGTWEAEIASATETEEGELHLRLRGLEGRAICGEQCGEHVPIASPADFRVEVIVVPHVEGPVVPVAAIHTDPGGNAFVTLADGTEVQVAIQAASAGLAVVEGVEAGDIIRLPLNVEDQGA